MSNLNEYDWYCDECDAYLNSQPGFDADCGSWTCTECGYENDIDESELIDDDELQDFEASGCSSLNEYRYGSDDDDDDDDSESLSVWDAALIWLSKGKDEDYMFGYTEEELEDAL